ncbi:GMC family oxidoreductase N-terminal domain-containing protein [Bacteroidota bacterium]
MSKKHYNAIIVGAGAGGGVVAKELSAAGLTVALMERGDWPIYDKHIVDELISQRTFVLGSVSGPDWHKNPRVFVHPDGRRETLLPNDHRYSPLAACVGSGTVTYGAMAWRYMREDFRLVSTYGNVEGSTLEDWPVSYEELEPYYEKAEWEIGVSGKKGANPFEAPRKKDYPMPPFEAGKEGTVLSEAAKRLGFHPFPIPMLRNSVPYNNRPGCIRNRTCVGFQCPVDAKNGSQNTVIPVALRTGNCDLYTNAKVAEILSKPNGNVEGIRFFNADDKEEIITSDIIVVSGSATESARLMLNSKSDLFPNGLGNNNDWVGRNLQGHAYTSAYGLFEYDIKEYAGPGATIGLCDFNHHNEGIVGGGLLCNEFNNLAVKTSGRSTMGKGT